MSRHVLVPELSRAASSHEILAVTLVYYLYYTLDVNFQPCDEGRKTLKEEGKDISKEIQIDGFLFKVEKVVHRTLACHSVVLTREK